jgi:hypothetical protein
MHWSFLNGECLVAYLYKKKIDPTYVPGKDLHRNDFDVIYKFSPETMKLIVLLQTIGWGISLYIVLKRCNFDKYMIYSFVLLYFAFYILRISTTDHYKNKTYLILQEINTQLSMMLDSQALVVCSLYQKNDQVL